jgi:chromosome segregation ATPase
MLPSSSRGVNSESRSDCRNETPAAASLSNGSHWLVLRSGRCGVDVSEHEQEVPPEKWQVLEARWKDILGLEASIETLRLSMDSLRAELEAAFKKSLAVEEKLHALQADVAQWNKAKSRIHYALPKAREFIHKAVWAAGAPERKRLEELHRNHIEPRIPFPEMDKTREELEHFQKDRQVLFAQGNTVYQECRGISGEIQRALSTLQRNAADNAFRKRSAKREKGKYF